MLEGEVVYRHGNSEFRMLPGDSLFFDADAPHGPDRADTAADPLSLDHLLSAEQQWRLRPDGTGIPFLPVVKI